MHETRCPTCGAPVAGAASQPPASFPFCSTRCKLRDLGAWFNEERSIAGRPTWDGDVEDIDRP